MKVINFAKKFQIVILLFFIVLINVPNLLKYPLASIDESWQSSDSYAFFDKKFTNINFPFLLQEIGIPTFNFWSLGLFYKVFGLGLFQGRLLIFFSSLVLALAVYKFTDFICGNKIALLTTVFFSTTEVFFFSSHLIRSDIFLSLAIVISFFLYFKYLTNNRPYLFFLCGFLLAFSFEIHMNGFLFLMGFIGALLLSGGGLNKMFSKKILVFYLGILVYGFYYFIVHALPNIPLFMSVRKYNLLIDHPPPIFHMGFNEMLWAELGRYNHYFSDNRLIEGVLILIAILWALRQKNIHLKFIAKYLLFSALLFTFFSANKAFFYLIYFFPFFSILLASFLFRFRRTLISIIYLYVVSINLIKISDLVRKYNDYDYETINKEVSLSAAPDSLIFGSPAYFLPLKNFQYRSMYVLSWYRIFENKDLISSLKIINPDIIILDDQLNSLLVDDYLIKNRSFQGGLYNLSKKDFLVYLDNYELVNFFDSKYYGKVTIYKLRKT